MTPNDIIAFWTEAGPERWFNHDEAFDSLCREQLLPAHEAAAAGDLDAWAATAEGALALVILLDQIPRNVFRGSPRTWASDGAALRVAERALAARFDQAIEMPLRQFFYLPFMHAEDRAMQGRSLALYAALGDRNALHFARHHHDVVQRFGRFPHRNAVLGRASTPDEEAFLAKDGFRG